MTKFYRLIYKSECAPQTGEADFRTIAMLSALRNKARGVTGLLLTHENRIMQVLEGPKSEVEALYSKIVADTRHVNVHIVSEQSIEAPKFRDWSMGFRPVENESDLAKFQSLGERSLNAILEHGSGQTLSA